MKNSKHFFTVSAVLTGLVLSLCLSACGSRQNSGMTKSLYARGMDVVQLMYEMTRNEEYTEIYTGNSEIRTIVNSISTGDFTTPKAVYAISLDEEALDQMDGFLKMDAASKELKTFLRQRFLSSLMTQLNGMSGAGNLAAASVCSAGTTFVNENAEENVIYLYTFENAVPAAVTFTAGENHAVSANGVFILYDQFSCGSAEEIKTFFQDIEIEVSEVSPE